ncbi:ABC transporter ATP-binding protein [Tepidimicrobium xylanilyticum]|nr:ABC transporter ATP-binding protein [Tepidimicrobium xylanilyticum]
MSKLLEVTDLKTYFYTDDGVVKAVDGVSFSVDSGKTIGIVGESGCGKSVTAMSILRLIPDPPGKIVNGEIIFEGEDLTKVSDKRIREIRGNNISVIFQEPMTSLNPVFTVGYQIGEVLMLHQKLSEEEARERAIEMIRLVGIPNPERIVDEYPHQLSGGMRQRIMIAMALACQPRLLIADEPTTALDVTIQAQILEIMNDLKNKLNTSIMLITHDLGVVAEMADHVIVMYSGKVVEDAPIIELFKNPRHPYTIGLMGSIPSLVKEG